MAIQQMYGRLRDGRRVDHFLLRNASGMEVGCIGYGCRLTHFLLPLPRKPGGGGRLLDVLLGYDDLASYEDDPDFHGAFLGRYAGRMPGDALPLGGRQYPLAKGADGHYMHGGFSKRLFESEVVGDNSVRFTYQSPDGEDGFPGEVWVSVQYTLTPRNELVIDYRARADRPTELNFSNHFYFNLAGNQKGGALDQLLALNSIGFIELGEGLLPTGRALPSDGGAFEFRTEKPIGRDMAMRDPQLYLAGGYEHCFVLQKSRYGALVLGAILRDAATARTLRVYTTQPGLTLYTGNRLTGSGLPGKGGRVYPRRAGICLQPMHFPASPAYASFPPTLLAQGREYHETTVLAASW